MKVFAKPVTFVLAAFMLAGTTLQGAQRAKHRVTGDDRVVCLGDSMTDGHTYPLLIQQALEDAGLKAPTIINAGVGGDTIKMMRRRLDRDVLSKRPTVVTIHAGANDAARGVEPEDYAADLQAVVDRLRQAQARVILMTTTPVGPKHEAHRALLLAYDRAIHRTARRHDLTVARVRQSFRTKANTTEPRLDQLEDDQLHLSFKGYRAMTRALLDAFGYPRVPVPERLETDLLPGVMRRWRVRAAAKHELPLNADAVNAINPEKRAWRDYQLPEPEPCAHWWKEQCRQRGFALRLDGYIGESKSFVATTTLTCETSREVTFSTGGSLQAIWVDGAEIFRSRSWTGFHAGKERVHHTLSEGRHRIVIETGATFFLSVTDHE
ncbi:MAG: SGNH/GDSL hydrolase family protein [bacterium]